MNASPAWARRAAALAAIAAAAIGAGAGGSLATPAATAAPTLYVMYSMNCTFTVVDDAGRTITSIPPGTYQVDVRTPVQFGTLPLPASPTDMTACRGSPQFQLTGPGVSIFTTMTAGCEMDKVFTATFQPSSTYVAVDLNQPAVARASFTTLASGSPAPPVVTYGGGKGVAQASQDIVGSEALQGTLHLSIGAHGAPLLALGGKAVSRLKAGRYRFVPALTGKAGVYLIGPTWTAPKKLTGKRAVTITLTSGRWTYYATLKTIRYFLVA